MITFFHLFFGIFNKAFILTHTYMKMSTKHARLRILRTSSSFYKTASLIKATFFNRTITFLPLFRTNLRIQR